MVDYLNLTPSEQKVKEDSDAHHERQCEDCDERCLENDCETVRRLRQEIVKLRARLEPDRSVPGFLLGVGGAP